MTKITAYITKYALTQGIYTREAVVNYSDLSGSMICCSKGDLGRLGEYYHGPDWHYTFEEAIARAELMRNKKLASMEKAKKKLMTLDFRVIKP